MKEFRTDRLRSSELEILKYIAREGRANKYETYNAVHIKSYATVFEGVNSLEKAGFIKEMGRGSRKAIFYGLTFRGLVELFATLFYEAPRTPEEDKRWLTVKRVVEAFRQHNKYALFEETETLEKWFGAKWRFYECLMSLSAWLRDYPPSIYVLLEHVGGDLARLIKETPFPKRLSEIFIYGYTYMFFRYAWAFREKEVTGGPFLNPTLHRLAQETLETSSQSLKQELETLDSLKRAYAIDFKE